MEKTIKKLLVTSGLIASAAVALLPLTSYAAQTVTGPGYAHGYACNDAQPGNECARANQQEGGPTVVTVDVKPVLSIDATSGGDVIQAYPDTVRSGKLSAQIRSAVAFTVSLSAEVPYLQNEEVNEYVIPASNVIEAGKSAWGIKKSGATDQYTALTTRPEVFYEGPAQDDPAWIDFEVGVSAGSRLPQGIYSTEVTITAAVKN